MNGLHTTVKVVGSKCNYDCQYCFYLEKESLLNSHKSMSHETLEAYVRNYISSQSTPEVEFAWHGGEPTLAGIGFFEKAVEFQRKYAGDKIIKNTLQTNGSRLDEKWCRFFRENNFLVGLSLDGPEWLQGKYRTKQGKSVFDEIMKALKLLQKMNVEFNVLACVSKEYCGHAEAIYSFFRKHKVKHIQFSPLVESLPSEVEQSRGQHFGSNLIFSTAKLDEHRYNPVSWAVDAKEYGKFLVDIFNLWIAKDVGKVFIANFEQALTQFIGNPSPNCIHAKNCGSSYAVESNGDVYFCDHVAYPESKIGNVVSTELKDIAGENKNLFNKESRLSQRCKNCQFLQLCNGGCPKHRYLSDTGEYENVLCEGYYFFFNSIHKYLQAMTTLLANGYPASYVMQALNGPLILTTSK